MSLIINYTVEEKKTLIDTISSFPSIGDGSEGECFFNKGDVYKIYKCDDYIRNTICKDDIPLDSFMFPIEIYKCNKEIFASKTRYIGKNYIDIKSTIRGNVPDINKIKQALIPFIRDLYILSKNHIIVIDLQHNLLFNGERFYAVDTLSYVKDKKNTFEKNIRLLELALLVEYADLLSWGGRNENSIKLLGHIIELGNSNYINMVAKEVIEEENKYKNTQKIKR